MTIEELKNNGWVVYEFIRGSHCHGIATETSDIDLGGVFIIPQEYLMGTRDRYVEQVADPKGDVVYYELGRWIELLMKSNPTVLESLFIDDEFVTIKPCDAIKPFFDNRDAFLSKDCFDSLFSYSRTQIQKARNYKRYCATPITVRLTPIDFCYTFDDNQGVESIVSWLTRRGLKQKYVGLSHCDKMNQMFGVYYDWQEHIRLEYDKDTWLKICDNYMLGVRGAGYSDEIAKEFKDYDKYAEAYKLIHYMWEYFKIHPLYDLFSFEDYVRIMYDESPKGYHGIQNEEGTSTEVRLDSIIKGDKPLTHMQFNNNGFSTHCKQYKNYKDWEAKRNPTRYDENKGYFFDAKNMCECSRLVLTGIDLARDGKLIINRKNERDFLLEIKKHKKTYEEIMTFVTEKQEEFDQLCLTSTLPEHPDYEMANRLLIEARQKYYNS